MTPLQAVDAARAAGASLVLDAGTLRVRAARPLPAELVAELRAHRDALVRLLAEAPPSDGAPCMGCGWDGPGVYLVAEDGSRTCGRCCTGMARSRGDAEVQP